MTYDSSTSLNHVLVTKSISCSKINLTLLNFGVLFLGRENGMISGPAVLKSLWNDLDVLIGQLKWVWWLVPSFQKYQPQFGCWELKNNAAPFVHACPWAVPWLWLLLKNKAAGWNMKWSGSKMVLCLQQETSQSGNEILFPVVYQAELLSFLFTKWWTLVMERNHDKQELKTMFYYNYFMWGCVTITFVS